MTELVIDVRDLHKTFGERHVVKSLSLQVSRGEICGFLGANGSGKTTTIRMLCGLLAPDSGEGTCLEYDIRREAAQIRRQTGYMTQKFSYYEDLTAKENLELVAGVYEMHDQKAAVRDIMERMNLGRYENQLAGHLSGGWKQRLALAACVLHRPRLLLLDEPTAGVDAKARREFWDMISDLAAGGMTVLVSTHYMDEAERCHRVVYLSGGRLIVQGPAASVVAKAGLTVFEATGDALAPLVRRARSLPGLESATVLGRALRVVGSDRAAVERAVDAMRDAPVRWREVPARLDDVFIHLLSHE